MRTCTHRGAEVNNTAQGMYSALVKCINTERIQLSERDSVNQISEKGGSIVVDGISAESR